MQSKFTLLGDKGKLRVGIGVSITRKPWPLFDVKGSDIEFGDEVVISSGVQILTHDHQFHKKNWRDLNEIHHSEPTIIDDYAFIGINAIILPTCKKVGRYSVVAAGSVVTKNIPDYEIWAGNPAQKIGDVEKIPFAEVDNAEEG